MNHTGCINWPRTGELNWRDTGEGSMFVFAYWLRDYKFEGMDLFDQEARGSDWFLRGTDADVVRIWPGGDDVHASPNIAHIDDGDGILAAVCLGSSAGVYHSPMRDGYFWAGMSDLNAAGRKLVSALSGLYERSPVLITYLDLRPMSPAVPEAAHDQATVVAVSGLPVA